MADFPANTTLLDDFNRADETPPTGWPDRVYGAGDGQLGVASNALQGGGDWRVAVHEDALPSDFDLTLELDDVGAAGASSMFMHVHLQDPGTSSVTGYAIGVLSGQWTITRIDSSSSFSNLRSTAIGFGMATGDMLGVRSEGISLQLWHKPAAGDWTLRESIDENTYRGGQFGFEIQSPSWRIDNVRGGAPDAGPVYSELSGTIDSTGGPESMELDLIGELGGTIYGESVLHGSLERFPMPDLIVDPPAGGDDTVVITLDTTAPVVTFGAHSDAEAGQLFQAEYTVDEEGVVSARLEPAAGDAISLTVLADMVEGFVPPGTFGGPATLRIFTRDDLDNEGEYTLVVPLTSPLAAPTRVQRTGPGIRPGARGRRSRDRTLTTRSRVHVTSRSASRARSSSRSSLRLQSRDRSRAYVGSSSDVHVVSSTRVSASARTRNGVALSVATSVRRREGPDEETAFALLL